MPPRRRDDLNCHRHDIFGQARQVADHTTGPVGQGQLDRRVQLPDPIAEPAGNINDRHLTYRMFPGPNLPTHGRTAGWLRWQRGRHVGIAPGGKPGQVRAQQGVCGKVMYFSGWLNDRKLDSVVPE
jgi:hypothetical protein